jgi:hypothetical protein
MDRFHVGPQFYPENTDWECEHHVCATAETIVRDAVIGAREISSRLGPVNRLFKNIRANHVDGNTYQEKSGGDSKCRQAESHGRGSNVPASVRLYAQMMLRGRPLQESDRARPLNESPRVPPQNSIDWLRKNRRPLDLDNSVGYRDTPSEHPGNRAAMPLHADRRTTPPF